MQSGRKVEASESLTNDRPVSCSQLAFSRAGFCGEVLPTPQPPSSRRRPAASAFRSFALFV